MNVGDKLKDQWGVEFEVTELCFPLEQAELDEGEDEAWFVKLKDSEGLSCNGFAIKKEIENIFILDEIETEAESEEKDFKEIEKDFDEPEI